MSEFKGVGMGGIGCQREQQSDAGEFNFNNIYYLYKLIIEKFETDTEQIKMLQTLEGKKVDRVRKR